MVDDFPVVVVSILVIAPSSDDSEEDFEDLFLDKEESDEGQVIFEYEEDYDFEDLEEGIEFEEKRYLLLGFYPEDMDIEVEIDPTTGEIVRIEKPLWYIVVAEDVE